MRAILKGAGRLLWNGGIGTYVKAEARKPQPTSAIAQQRAARQRRELRCRIVGEAATWA